MGIFFSVRSDYPQLSKKAMRLRILFCAVNLSEKAFFFIRMIK